MNEIADKMEAYSVLLQCKSKNILDQPKYIRDNGRNEVGEYFLGFSKANLQTYYIPTFNGIAFQKKSDFNKLKDLEIFINGNKIGSWNKKNLKYDVSNNILKKKWFKLELYTILDHSSMYVLDLVKLPIPITHSNTLTINCSPSFLLSKLYLTGTHIYTIEDRWLVRELINDRHLSNLDKINRGEIELPYNVNEAVKILKEFEKMKDINLFNLNYLCDIIADCYLQFQYVNHSFEIDIDQDIIINDEICVLCESGIKIEASSFYLYLDKYAPENSDKIWKVIHVCENCQSYPRRLLNFESNSPKWKMYKR